MSRNQEVYIITKPNGEQFTALIKWTVSRGQYSYGYNICSLWLAGGKVASCDGGGYDMRGTVLAEWFTKEAGAKLKKVPANYGSGDNYRAGFHGLSHYNAKRNKRQRYGSKNTRTSLNGACGWDSVARIMERLKYRITEVR